MLICDFVLTEQDGTRSLIRVREGFPCEALPGNTRPCTVFLVFREVRGPIHPVLRITKVNPETGEDIEVQDIHTANAKNPHGTGPTDFAIILSDGLPLEGPGDYRLRVMIGEHEVGKTRVVAWVE